MKQVKDGKTPSRFEGAKHKGSKANPRGSAPATKGGGMSDEQFDKGESYDADDGGSTGTAEVDSHPGSVSGVGSADHSDQQFTKRTQGNSGRLGSKSSGGTPGKFDGQELSPAASIMREVAKAVQKGPGPDQDYQGSKKASSPKSKSQTKSFKASNAGPTPKRFKGED